MKTIAFALALLFAGSAVADVPRRCCLDTICHCCCAKADPAHTQINQKEGDFYKTHRLHFR